MVQFHLNIFDDDDVRDIEGVERPDLAAAILDAIAGARGLMARALSDQRGRRGGGMIAAMDEPKIQGLAA